MLLQALKKYKAKSDEEQKYIETVTNLARSYILAGEVLINKSTALKKDES